MGDIVLVEGTNELNVEMWPTGVPVPGKGLIWGFVTDSAGRAIPEVKITCDGIVRYTGSEGQYEIRDLDYRQYKLEFSKEAYQTVTRYATPDTQLNITLPFLPTKPSVIYAYPEVDTIKGGHNVSLGIIYRVYTPTVPGTSKTDAYLFTFYIPGFSIFPPWNGATVTFNGGTPEGLYEGKSTMYISEAGSWPRYFDDKPIPPGTYPLYAMCEHLDLVPYRATVKRTFFKDLDTGSRITIT